MIDLGDPIHSSDTAYIRSTRDSVFTALGDPFGHVAFWAGLRTTDQRLSAEGEFSVGDSWRIHALSGVSGVDAEIVVTDIRRKDHTDNIWMDVRGHVDPFVGLPLARWPFEAEAEWYLRDWRAGTLATMFWRVRSEPERAQQRLLLLLRRVGWHCLHGLKCELEA